MESLETLARLNPGILCPGHGQIIHDGSARIAWYARHRNEREEQVLAALAEGAGSVEEIVTAVYPQRPGRQSALCSGAERANAPAKAGPGG